MKRIGIGGFWHETNTYSSRPTELGDFEAFELLAGEAVMRRHSGTGSVVGGMVEESRFQPIPLLTAGAWPSGRVTSDTLEELLDRWESSLRSAGQLDGLLLNLHGAMVGEGSDDVEHLVVRAARALVDDAPIVSVLDLHGNPSPSLVELCEALVSYDTYPHVDMRERGAEAARLMIELLEGARLRCLIRKIPVLVSALAQATDEQPMKKLRDHARERERRPGIRRISLLPGFPYADVARAGFSVVVVHEDGADGAAEEVADELAGEVEQLGEEWVVSRPDPTAAVSEAIKAAERPVVLADVADNIGGGAPGDGTALLAELLAQGPDGAVVTIADPDVVEQAVRVGEGGSIRAEVGGKTDRLHGDPVPIQGRVVRLTDGRYRALGTWMTGQEFSMGGTAVIDVSGLTLVVTERPTPPFHREQLTSVGIDPGQASVLVVKGAIAWREAYGDVAARVIEVDTPGICPVDPYLLERTTEPMRV